MSFNPFALAAKADDLKKLAEADAPKVLALLAKFETVLQPIFDAVIHELLKAGTITQAQVDEAKLLIHEAEALEKELEPTLKKLAK